MDVSSPGRDAVLAQLERVLSSPLFRRAERSSALLRFIVERSLDGQDDRLKEYTLGAEALGRGESFDPRTDPVVRAEAFRLRSRLEQYKQDPGPRRPARPRAAQRQLRPAVPAPERVQALRSGASGRGVVLSPDGSRVVFVSRSPSGRTHLNARRLDQPTSIPLSGTDGARVPFFSPDGRWVAFWADRSLRKAPVDGGSPVVLCEAADILGASWGEDDSIVMASEPLGKLWRVPAAGGVPQAVIDLTAESATPRWPQILPGGRFVLYTASAGAGADP